jgi:dsRNA-specific ribonuclease
VSKECLALCCYNSGLAKYIKYLSDNIHERIVKYYKSLEKDQEGNVWLHEPPKALCDLMESVIGALYVSSGYDFF